MKKLLVLLLLPLFSFGQIIVNQRTVEVGKKLYIDDFGSIKKQTKTITTTFNITEIEDEFIEVYIGSRFHWLSTSKHKNVPMSARWKKKNWNVYDGDELIPLYDEVDVLNFFSKYGFEFVKQNTKPTAAWTTSFSSNSAVTTIRAESSITLRNNNNNR